MSATAAGISSPLLAPALSGGDTSPFLWRSGAILGRSPCSCCWCVNSRDDRTIAFAGMLTGALGTHGLKRRAGITAADLHAWETASTYAILHTSLCRTSDTNGWCDVFGKHHGARSAAVRILYNYRVDD
ncbi:hypothetical protein JVT61DRAFT_5704 [Boletus reticuloceps]|uniref:Uncharacterized protein n=1 Tax=Boletus reticuloceps TaxID=495285 RepID=A0A8I2Z207_9AGAM|nr:hypothetical protein JVT61DRAFT_5704 [Boletus reticuloceps]